jgi:glycine cleavage system transcriptional repressor
MSLEPSSGRGRPNAYGFAVSRFSLSALGVDGPGIVAAISGVLGEQGCNLEDSTATILQGHFAILLVVTAPDEATAGSLEAALGGVAKDLDLVISVRPMKDSDSLEATLGAETFEPITVSVHGADRPGIVHAIAGALAEGGGNVLDLSTRLIGENENPVYVMTLRAEAPSESIDQISDAVIAKAHEMGVHSSVRRDETDVL